MLDYKITQRKVVTTFDAPNGLKSFVASDIHFDSVYCDRKQFFNDMNYAMENDLSIIINGDLFDAMNGRFDPRRDMAQLRPEYRSEDYYDVILEDAAKKLNPYASNIALITRGNHELSVLKNANTDLIGRLVEKLSTKNHTVYAGGYGGIILLKEKNLITAIKYYHGSGGEAPVTKGAIQTNRQAVYLPDFNVVLNGHSHNAYWIPLVRERITTKGKHYYDIQHHVRTPGYLMSYADGSGGWEVTRGGVPKPIGSCILDIKLNDVLVVPMIHAPKSISPVKDIYQGMIFPQE